MRQFPVRQTSRRSRTLDTFGGVLSIAGVGLLVLALLAVPVVSSILAYHWLDRPDRYVDGRWFTIGCVVFWSLVGSGGSSVARH